MARQAARTASANPFVKVRVFYDEVMTEMAKVTWPSWEELKTSTSVVLLLLGILAGIIYAYDVVFQVVMFNLFKLT